MLNEKTLKYFSLDALYGLMILKLEELEKMSDRNLRTATRLELELIQKVIEKKKKP